MVTCRITTLRYPISFCKKSLKPNHTKYKIHKYPINAIYRHPNKQPNTRVSDHPNIEEFDEQPNQHGGLQGGDMGARHPWKPPNTRAPGHTTDPLDLLPAWWKAVEKTLEKSERRRISVTTGPAVRNARRFSKKSTASRSCIAWWTIWWLRMEREARTDRQTE